MLSTLPSQVVQSYLIFTATPWNRFLNPFCQRGKSGTERLTHLSGVEQQPLGRARGQTQAVWPQSLCSVSHYVILWLPPSMSKMGQTHLHSILQKLVAF